MGGKVDWREQERKAAAEAEWKKACERQQLVASIRQDVEESKRAVGFAALSPLPGEDPKELDDLMEALRRRYEPEDVAQADALRTVAEAMYRKQRRKIFQEAATARMRWGSYFAFPHDQGGLLRILGEIAEPLVKREKANNPDGDEAKNQDGDPSKKTTDSVVPVTLVGSPAEKKEPSENATPDKIDAPIGLPDVHLDPAITCWMYDKANELEATYARDFGAPITSSVIIGNAISQQMKLAMMGDLISPESCLAELRLIEELDRAIDRSLRQFMQ